MSESKTSPCIHSSNDGKSRRERGRNREREKLPVAIFCEPHHLNHMIPGTEDVNNKVLVLTVARCHFSNQQNGF